MFRAALSLGIAVSLSLAAECGTARGEEPEHTTAKVLEAWQKRRAAVRTMDYVALGEGRIPRGGLNGIFGLLGKPVPVGDLPTEERVFPVRARLAASLRDRKLRIELQDDYPQGDFEAPPTFVTRYWTFLFDGTIGFKYIPDEYYDEERTSEPQTQLVEETPDGGDTGPKFIPSRIRPFLLAHGLVPAGLRNMSIDDLAVAPVEVPYELVDPMPRKDDGMLIMRSKPMGPNGDFYREIWVDPKRDYLITRLICCQGAKTLDMTDLTYKEVDGEWLLAAWQFVWSPGDLERSYKFKVHSVELNEELPDDLFVPPIKDNR